jgi:hypothetical protein
MIADDRLRRRHSRGGRLAGVGRDLRQRNDGSVGEPRRATGHGPQPLELQLADLVLDLGLAQDHSGVPTGVPSADLEPLGDGRDVVAEHSELDGLDPPPVGRGRHRRSAPGAPSPLVGGIGVDNRSSIPRPP